MRVTLDIHVRVELDAEDHAHAADAALDAIEDLRAAVQFEDPTDNAVALLDALEGALGGG